MPNIKYSYIFDEELDRVYDCLTNAQLNLGIAYNNLVTKLHFIKGDRFDEENAEFSFIWKNYYEIKMIVQNVKKKENFRTYTNKSLDIDKLSLQISLTYYYYWDTIGQNTLLILDLEYKDEFFGDLIKTDFSKSDVLNICNNIKNYINSIIQGLDINNSFLVKAPIEELWKTISNPEIFFTISGKKLIPIFKEKEVQLNSVLEFYDSNDKQINPTIMTQMRVDILFVTSNYIKLSFVTFNRLKIAAHRITFIIKKVEDKKSMVFTKVKILEPCEHKIYLAVKRFWRKIMVNYYNHFESKSKKKSNKILIYDIK
jgi:hypothetical protein